MQYTLPYIICQIKPDNIFRRSCQGKIICIPIAFNWQCIMYYFTLSLQEQSQWPILIVPENYLTTFPGHNAFVNKTIGNFT